MIEHYIPEPRLIIGTNAPWPMAPLPNGDCPICGQGIRAGDDNTYCLVCDTASPAIEARIRAARLGTNVKERSELAEVKARARLAKHPTVLIERERRQVFNGYKGGVMAACDNLTNRSRTGREWLARIGQLPDWSIDLTKGRRQIA